MIRSSRAMLADRERVSELRLGTNVVQRICLNSQATATQTGEMWVDTGADTCCIGQGFHIQESGCYVTLQGYSDRLNSQERIPVVSTMTVLDLDDGWCFTKHCILGTSSQYPSLLNLNQIRYTGHKADAIPLFLSQGRLLHGIEMINGDHIPFQLKGKSSLLYTRSCMLTEKEMDTATLIELTSDAPWDPASETDWEGKEEKYTRKHHKTRIVHSKPDQMVDNSEDNSAHEVLGFNHGE
jgi:hypothetical protein